MIGNSIGLSSTYDSRIRDNDGSGGSLSYHKSALKKHGNHLKSPCFAGVQRGDFHAFTITTAGFWASFLLGHQERTGLGIRVDA